ncbi:MAG: macro domain-containing protein [Vicinamibacteria bacterium]|jgi:O-acetyl-ADP-ribose deacetylase (regulator of RNase III)|nr:macro domain-containing protein [Vicinamibacteria bacterium]
MDVTPIAVLEFGAGRSFVVVLGDLLKQSVDTIVNAANGHLAHGGGIAAAIASAAGPELINEGDRYVAAHGALSTGGAVKTTAGRLPFKAVIHVVGPRQGQGNEEALLEQALLAAFQFAEENGWTSLAFPAVSSGIYAVPAEVCAEAYLRAVRCFFCERSDSTLRTIRLVLWPGPIAEILRKKMTASA